jgi:gliding motility-associated-like protein
MMSVVYVHQEDCPPVTPNVFTPNGDGVNDGWSLYRPYAEGIHVWIYDRWGMLVYEYTEPDGYWDGTYMGNGKPVTDGVYYFIAYITDTNAMITGESGFIQLIRNGPK